MKNESVAVILGAISGLIAISFLFSYPLMLLWNNCLVPAVDIIREVGWLQMWGISFLLPLLFGSKFNTKS